MQSIKNSTFNKPIILSLLSGILLIAAWPMSPLTPLIFVAFIPLFYLADSNISKRKFFFYIFLAKLIWNVGTTWWIWFASPPGAISAFIANSLLMTLPWLMYRRLKTKLSKNIALIGFICFWMFWEYFHLNDWGLSWPWLTVGNVFAKYPSWVQWYSYTGVSGGTLWVLVLNILFYKLILAKDLIKNKIFKAALYTALLVVLPLLLSSFKVNQSYKADINNNIVIAQPNIDAYAKVTNNSFAEQLNTLITTSAKEVDSNTTLLVWPETALYDAGKFNEATLQTDMRLRPLFDFLAKYPKLNLLTGIESYAIVEQPTAYSRKFIDAEKYYEAYNGAVLLSKDGVKQFYHKSKLVPGVETLPKFLNFMGKWFEDFGGTTNGYAVQKHRTPMVVDTMVQLAPSICYESIYGEFMSEYVHNGAGIIAIITNDGWWQNTPGHQQHFAYASLRAIENRKPVVRSANTGISGVINEYGIALKQLNYDQQGAIKTSIINNNQQTFYTRFPDLLYKIAILLALIIFSFYVAQFFKN